MCVVLVCGIDSAVSLVFVAHECPRELIVPVCIVAMLVVQVLPAPAERCNQRDGVSIFHSTLHGTRSDCKDGPGRAQADLHVCRVRPGFLRCSFPAAQVVLRRLHLRTYNRRCLLLVRVRVRGRCCGCACMSPFA